MKKGKFIVVSGPSGVGKGTICNNRCYLNKSFQGAIFMSENVTYCLIARTNMANKITPTMLSASYLINVDGETCQMSGGGGYADCFKI